MGPWNSAWNECPWLAPLKPAWPNLDAIPNRQFWAIVNRCVGAPANTVAQDFLQELTAMGALKNFESPHACLGWFPNINKGAMAHDPGLGVDYNCPTSGAAKLSVHNSRDVVFLNVEVSAGLYPDPGLAAIEKGYTLGPPISLIMAFVAGALILLIISLIVIQQLSVRWQPSAHGVAAALVSA